MSNASETDTPRCDPTHVAVSKSRGITIHWGDGHRSEYALGYLRDHCPCATCAEVHRGQSASPFPMFKPAVRLNAVEPVGNYALRLIWSDGHSTGIYTWEYLRSICTCAECAAHRETH